MGCTFPGPGSIGATHLGCSIDINYCPENNEDNQYKANLSNEDFSLQPEGHAKSFTDFTSASSADYRRV